MKTLLRLFILIFSLCSVIACSKDERPSSNSGDKNDMFRDWTKKGERTPAPPPGRVFNKD